MAIGRTTTTLSTPRFGARTAQFNKSVEQLLPLLQNLLLWKKRMGGYRELEEMRGQRSMELENLRSANTMGQLEQMFINQISQDPTVDALSSKLNQKILMGEQDEEFGRLKEELTNRVTEVSRAAVQSLSPTQGVIPENMETMLRNLGTTFTGRLISEGQMGKRQRVDIEEVQKPSQALAAERKLACMPPYGKYLKRQNASFIATPSARIAGATPILAQWRPSTARHRLESRPAPVEGRGYRPVLRG